MNKSKSQISRRNFLAATSAAAAALSMISGCGEKDRKLSLAKIPEGKPRNVIFILSDDHRYDFMGFLGKPSFLETPNMDRIAQNGAYLKNATVATALCSPSRASILTGQYAHKHGVVDNNRPIPEGTVFFPQYLQQHGYQTGFFGKWHMGHETDDPRPGFNQWVSFKGQGVYYDPELNINGQKVKKEGHISDILTDHVLDWLNQRNTEKPFFLYLSHKAVHAMFEPAKRHLGKYENVKLEYPASMADTDENYRGKPDWVRAQRNSWHGVDYMYHGQMNFDTFYRRYCETLLSIDDSIGRVMNYLFENGLDQSTMVFYMGDNGFLFGEHGLIDKRCMYEESMRVPLLAYCPDVIKPGSVITEQVQNIDIAPTILELAGLKTPENMNGQSFVPLLEGKKVEWREAVLYEYYWERNFPQTPTVHGIRTNKFKYIHYHGIWDTDELYDLENDPNEMNNLIDSPEHQEIINKLKNQMFEMLESTGGMVIPLQPDAGQQLNKRRPPK
ncbi:sulfatase [candidate division KSB1 bacterium]|nr:sulfatase [candidate division KSB1 bacterium]